MATIRGKHPDVIDCISLHFHGLITSWRFRSCRGWYHHGRQLAIEEDTPLHITAPYLFSEGVTIGQSATAPLMDPNTGEHVGQVLVDFISNNVADTLGPAKTRFSKGGFPIMIAVQGDPDSNTVIGPGFVVGGDESKEISEVVLPFDHNCTKQICSENLARFQKVVASMKLGLEGTESFTRTTRHGRSETVWISYSPSKVESIRPIGTNFGSGVNVTEHLVYSVGLCEPEDDLLEPFVEIETTMRTSLRWVIGGLAGAMILAALLVVYVSYLVAASVTRPMRYLRELIRCINK